MNKYHTDNDLVDQIIHDNSLAFDKLFEKYAHKLYGFALRYLKSENDAEELVHNVFVKIWEKRKELKHESSIKSFLFTVTYNDILKQFRKRNYHRLFVNETLSDPSFKDNSDERIEYASVLEYVDELIEKLPEKRKLIFIKSRKEGKSSKEIAKELNMSPGSIDNHISEAIQYLKTNLKKESLAVALFIALFI